MEKEHKRQTHTNCVFIAVAASRIACRFHCVDACALACAAVQLCTAPARHARSDCTPQLQLMFRTRQCQRAARLRALVCLRLCVWAAR